MQGLPDAVTRDLSPAKRDEVVAWWSAITDGERSEFLALWDARSDDTAYYATQVDGRTEWHELPIELHAAFVDPEDAREHEMWTEQLCEYLQARPEIDFFLVHRTFHICRAHAKAREVMRTGTIPHDFACPLDDASCPFAQALSLSPGRAILLVPIARRSA